MMATGLIRLGKSEASRARLARLSKEDIEPALVLAFESDMAVREESKLRVETVAGGKSEILKKVP